MDEVVVENKADSAVTPGATGNTNNTIDNNRPNDSKLSTAAILAFVPYTGIFGVHNFILKQYKKGIAHIAIFIACYAPHAIINISCKYDDSCYGVAMLTIFLQYLAIASYIWAIVEGVQILQLKKQKASSLPVTNNLNATQSSGSTTDTGNFVAGQSSPETVVNTEQGIKQDRKMWSILSFIATIIPIILWICCFTVSGGSMSENGSGAVWWLVVLYYWSLGIPLAIISIAFGIIGLKTSLRQLSIASILLKITMIIVVVLLLFIH